MRVRSWLRARAPLLGALGLLGTSACDSRSAPSYSGGSPTGPAGAAPPRPLALTPLPNSAPPGEAAPPTEPTNHPGDPAPALGPHLTTTFRLGEVSEVGPAGPMAALPSGVVLVTRSGELRVARRSGATFARVLGEPEEFAKFGRGPALSGDTAYWVSGSGELLRRSLRGGEPELLADHGAAGARVSVLRVAERDVVSFVRLEGDDALAYVWAEGNSATDPELLRVSPEGSAATSVVLVPTAPHPRALTLEGRTGMSPVHARTARITARRVTLEPDEVMWVGPGSHELTELVSIARPRGEATALVATARDVTHFGLAELLVPAGGGESPAPRWRLYPNGLDPAPVAASSFCGAEHALFVVPAHSRPRAPQELHLARLDAASGGPEEVIAGSGAFNDLSVAPARGGAVVAWTADRKTYALWLGCPSGGAGAPDGRGEPQGPARPATK